MTMYIDFATLTLTLTPNCPLGSTWHMHYQYERRTAYVRPRARLTPPGPIIHIPSQSRLYGLCICFFVFSFFIHVRLQGAVSRCVNISDICVTGGAKGSDGPEHRLLEGARMRHQRPCTAAQPTEAPERSGEGSLGRRYGVRLYGGPSALAGRQLAAAPRPACGKRASFLHIYIRYTHATSGARHDLVT